MIINSFQMQKKGFSLVELAMVLVIIGLLVAAIQTGQSLIRQARLRTTISEIRDINRMLSQFQAQYNAIPGDMINAHDFWGANCDATASNCNGNGDGMVEYNATATDNEVPRAWQHLNLAGYLNGTFDGTAINSNCDSNSCYYSSTKKHAYFIYNHAGGSYNFRTPAFEDSALVLYAGNIASATNWWYPAFTVPDAKAIDLKMDDGIANKGIMIDFHSTDNGGSGCSEDYLTAGGADFVATNLDDKSTKRCVFAILMN